MAKGTLPLNIVADTLNRSPHSFHRDAAKGTRPHIHVSDLMKSGSQYRFCPRETLLRHLEDSLGASGDVPAKMRLLWDTGAFLGDHVLNRFVKQSADYGGSVWGDWVCPCGHTVQEKVTHNVAVNKTCPVCQQGPSHYKETDLIVQSLGIRGHADMPIMDSGGLLHIYEIKSIDRADINFGEMDKPLADHVMQPSIYRQILRKNKYQVADNVRVLYIDRSMSDVYTEDAFKEFSAKPISAERITKLINKAKVVQRHYTNGTLPNRLSICTSPSSTRSKNCGSVISCFERKLKKLDR